jgi:hypothetical protein
MTNPVLHLGNAGLVVERVGGRGSVQRMRADLKTERRRLGAHHASRLRGFDATFGCFWEGRFWRHSRSRRNMLC